MVNIGKIDFAVPGAGCAGRGESDSITSCGGKGNRECAALGCNFYRLVFSRYIDRIGGSLNRRRPRGGARGKPRPAYTAQADGAKDNADDGRGKEVQNTVAAVLLLCVL